MKIYPIKQSQIVFRGSSNPQNHVMKRYCEPRTGVYYYYDSVQFENQKSENSFSNLIKNISNKFSKMSKAMKDTFIQYENTPDIDEII